MTEALPDTLSRGAYCELEALIELRYSARSLDIKQRKRALSVLSGPNKTNFRGRGIDFEEVRSYQPGDDIRTIDWRVTARTGEAHTKLFREERERPVLLVTDMRSSMFFGSRYCCKWVLAAERAARLCWSALQHSDRVGGLVLGDSEHREVRPKRSRRSALALLNHLVEMSKLLPGKPGAGTLAFTDMLLELRRVARPGSALFIISDFSGATSARALEQIYQLARHMDITAIHCSDPLERELPVAGRYSVTDGESNTDLYTGDPALREAFSQRFIDQFEQLRHSYGELGIPVIQAGTEQSALATLQLYYGDVRRRQP